MRSVQIKPGAGESGYQSINQHSMGSALKSWKNIEKVSAVCVINPKY